MADNAGAPPIAGDSGQLNSNPAWTVAERTINPSVLKHAGAAICVRV